jgi:glutamate synthase (NADPH) large chain
VIAVPVAAAHYWEGELRDLVERHRAETESPLAAEILRNWDEALPRFRQIVPKEMLSRLEHPLSEDREGPVRAPSPGLTGRRRRV